MRTSKNPVFNKVNNLSQAADSEVVVGEGGQVVIENATYVGVGLKIVYFLLVTIISAFLGLILVRYYPSLFVVLLIVSIFTGFISAILAMSKFKLSFVFGTLYCIGEGMFLGVVSMIAEAAIPGIIASVVAATLAVVVSCGLLFLTGLVKVNSRFNKFLLTAMFGFLISILLISILGWIGLIDTSGFALNVGISAISVLLASFVLISDMEQARQLVQSGGPKACEWMVAFGISYTVLWIYIELLRLAIIIFGNRN